MLDAATYLCLPWQFFILLSSLTLLLSILSCLNCVSYFLFYIHSSTVCCALPCILLSWLLTLYISLWIACWTVLYTSFSILNLLIVYWLVYVLCWGRVGILYTFFFLPFACCAVNCYWTVLAFLLCRVDEICTHSSLSLLPAVLMSMPNLNWVCFISLYSLLKYSLRFLYDFCLYLSEGALDGKWWF